MQLPSFLDRSAATGPFRAAVTEFLRSAQPSPPLTFDRRCPPVKVERTLTKLLESYPDLPIERVEIDARSGCEFFRGRLLVEAADRSFGIRFEWNCRWKAEQLGWEDWFGFPDQIRAAREFGHDCFKEWTEEPLPTQSAA